MPLKPSSLSFACESVRQFIEGGLADAPTNVTVQIGSPGEIDESNTDNIVNLFFYRFEPSGFGPLSISNQAWRLRVYCLVTVFGGVLENVGAGENELRMLGEVIRLFHETPIMDLEEFVPQGTGQPVAFRLNAVFQPLTEDQLSQFWTANSATAIRPSVAYDFSLVSIVPEQIHAEPPRVGAIGAESRSGVEKRYASPTAVAVTAPTMARTAIDIENPSWEPRICWVFEEQCHVSLTMSRTVAATFDPQVWVAGDPGATVDLVWQRWDPASGWEPVAGAPSSLSPFSREIDPDNIPSPISSVFPQDVPLPALGGSGARQVMLHARRTFRIAPGAPTRTVLSNPILISMFDSP